MDFVLFHSVPAGTLRSRDFHCAFDGKELAIVRGHTESDVVLMRSTQP